MCVLWQILLIIDQLSAITYLDNMSHSHIGTMCSIMQLLNLMIYDEHGICLKANDNIWLYET